MSGKEPRTCYVSNAALNAVAVDGQAGSARKPLSAIRIYCKDMGVEIIITIILMVLLASGVLTQFGIVVGSTLANVLVTVATI